MPRRPQKSTRTQRVNKKLERRTKAEPTLLQRYMDSPSMFDRVVSGDLPLPVGPGVALSGGLGVARAVGTSLARRAVSDAARRLAEKQPQAPVSPWVRRALGGNLPTKDMTNSTGPRADTYGGFSDVLRSSPYLTQSAAAELGATANRVMAQSRAKKAAPKAAKPKAKAPTSKGSAYKSPQSQRRKIVASENKRTKGRSAPTTTRTAKRAGGARVS